MTPPRSESTDRPRGNELPPAPPTERLFADLKKAAEKGLEDRGTPRHSKNASV
ncbi:MAG: hypothetical protein ACXVEG_11810 [Actinomycetota bacterium]